MSLNSTYDGAPERYERIRTGWLNRRRAAFIASRLQAWDLSPDSLVLEVGSGTGLLLRELAPMFPAVQFFGLEPQAAYIEYSAQKTNSPNLHFVAGKAEDAKRLFETRFAAVLSNDVLHHVESMADTVQSVTGIAAPGCRWLAIEPNAFNPYAFAGQSLKSGERNFSPPHYLRETRAVGWLLENKRYLFAIPPFIADPPEWLKTVELVVENIPFLGGGVCLEISRP